MASNIDSTLDRKPLSSDNSVGGKKQVGFSTSIDVATIDTPAPLEAAHAAEYVEFLRLKTHFESDPKAYKALVRRLDLRIIPMLFLFYLLNSLDSKGFSRSSFITIHESIYTSLEDTYMTSHQFNLALTWYFFIYAFLEAPSNMCMRKFGPKLWLSDLIIFYSDYCTARIMLGVFEAGLFQGFHTLSCWYLSSGLQTRCTYWYSVIMLSGAFGGPKQWQYLFIIEGVITIFVGLLGLWLCVDFLEAWSSRFFSPDEMNPIAPDDTFRWSAFWVAVKDWKTYFIASLLTFGGSAPTYSVNYTLATMVKSLRYSSIKTQAMTDPPYVFTFFVVILIVLCSDKYRCRARSLLISYFIGTAGVVILWLCLYYSNPAGVSYFALFLVVVGYNMQAPAVGSWLGTNFRNPAKRAAAMGWQSTFGQFVFSEAPTYNSGFITLLVLVMVGGAGATIANWYCLRKDRNPPEELEGKYTEQQLSKMGEYSPYFRYIL
ncbi:putative high-affinity nicotinic acid transporter [Acephala macrosclerotiorum]|nr:putative high-affinity nicotinic acid transporter [Acephala macrosclerotiorum]